MADKSVYSFSNVSVIYNGIQIEGFYQGDDLVRIATNNPLVTTQVGADGSGTFNVSGDRSGTITLKLLSSSPSNDLLAADWALISSRSSLISTAIRLVYVRHSNGNALATGLFAVSAPPADFQFGEKDTGRTWILSSTDIVIVAGRAGTPVGNL
jgi:hypothetical protein